MDRLQKDYGVNNIDRDYMVRKYHLDWDDGWRRSSVLFVSTVGSVLRRLARDYFKRGMEEMLERVKPSGIVLYGPVPPMDFAVPVLRHFDRLSPVRRESYQPDLDLQEKGV